MRNKLILATMLLCAGMYAHAQNYNPSPIPCKKITPTLLNNYNGIIDANCIEDENNSNTNININGNQNVELKAGEEINLDGEVWVHPNANGNFYAHIEPNEIGLAWYQPYGTPGSVLKYDKVEIGIDLPDDINQQIQNYLLENSNILKLNPFNPEQVDVKAEFYRNNNPNGTGSWVGPFKIYGFYYEEFIENTTDGNPLNWSLDPVASDYKFRVRFAPPYEGLWRCKINITLHQNTPQQVVYNATEFTFTVMNSANKGYVKVGSNNLYFQLGNETYFPIERNIPEPDLDLYGATYSARAVEDINTWDRRKTHPSYHKTFRDELSAYKNAGGDEFRTLFFADWYEIEFEKLNNYYDRLNSAWEFDRLVEHCSSIGLRMYFNLQNHEPFQWIGDQTRFWDWPAHDEILENQSYPTCYSWDIRDQGYCYHTDANFGVSRPEDFLTDANSKKFYKYRLRYITSRWGYDPNINLFEIRSEMNNTSKYSVPIQVVNPLYDINDSTTWPQVKCDRTNAIYFYYTNDDNFLGKVSDWNHEMAEYLKTHQYFPHLLSVDYTGCPRLMYPKDPNGNNFAHYAILLGDDSYYSEFVDVAAYNSYPGSNPISRFEGEVENNLDLNFRDLPNFGADYTTPIIHKPIIIGERGYEPGQKCDNGIEYIKDLWIGTFTGNANSNNQWHYQHNYDLLQHHIKLKDFIYGTDFHNIIWEPSYNSRNDEKATIFYLKSTNENKPRAIGVIDNKTVNYWTIGCGTNTEFLNTYKPNVDYEPNAEHIIAETISNGSGNNRLFVRGLQSVKKYTIDFFNPITGLGMGTVTKWSQGDGDLRIEYPDLSGYMPSSTNPEASPLIAFRVRRSNEPGFESPETNAQEAELLVNNGLEINDTLPAITITNWNEAKPQEQKLNVLIVTPNPSVDKIDIQFDGELKNASLKITDMQNSIIFSKVMFDSILNLDISAFASGNYLVILENNGKLYSQKLIKQ
jgi:hypothetical protein